MRSTTKTTSPYRFSSCLLSAIGTPASCLSCRDAFLGSRLERKHIRSHSPSESRTATAPLPYLLVKKPLTFFFCRRSFRIPLHRRACNWCRPSGGSHVQIQGSRSPLQCGSSVALRGLRNRSRLRREILPRR